MLDPGDEQGVIDKLWSVAAGCARAPDCRLAEDESFTPTRFDSRRAFGRYAYGSRGILIADGATYGIYITDVSRTGVGFRSPVQLFPRDTPTLVLPGVKKVEVSIRRCRRQAEQSYQCGAIFAGGAQVQLDQFVGHADGI